MYRNGLDPGCPGGQENGDIDDTGRHPPGQLSFTSPPPARDHHSTGEIVGVDVGAVHTATTSNGDHFPLPDFNDQYTQPR